MRLVRFVAGVIDREMDNEESTGEDKLKLGQCFRRARHAKYVKMECNAWVLVSVRDNVLAPLCVTSS